MGCPAKDWVKRGDTYLSVEQYKNITDVIRINDSLYRVKKGEELNQNSITQLFVDLQKYKNSTRTEKKTQRKIIRAAYRIDRSAPNTLLYVLVLLETKNNEAKIYRILSKLDQAKTGLEDRSLLNLAQLINGLLNSHRAVETKNTKINEKLEALGDQYELAKEEVFYLNKQVNDLKMIEESLHAREVGIELESR